jgi:hypothetical protein
MIMLTLIYNNKKKKKKKKKKKNMLYEMYVTRINFYDRVNDFMYVI